LRAALEKLAAPLRRRGLKVATRVAWDYPPFEAIVREALRSRPDLVVAGSRRHVPGARLFLTNNDWQLIRLCPVPLLFVKHERGYGKARVVAAIDPLHGAARRSSLDKRILESAQAMTLAHRGRLDVIHAYQSLYSYAPPIYGEAYVASIDPKIEQQHRARAQRALQRATAPFGIDPERLHLESGLPTAVLAAVARRWRIDLLVMGAVSRRGLGRLFIGSTAEHVLDHLQCDVLVVKPRGFRTTVPRRYSPWQMDWPAF
jgi:universal stress protein E